MKVYVDANPKAVCCVTEDGRTRYKELSGENTNNEAEYKAVIFAISQFPEATQIFSDSQLIVRQLQHVYHIKEDRLRELALQVWNNTSAEVEWLPRRENLAGKVLG
jgi:ribonuclease HI